MMLDLQKLRIDIDKLAAQNEKICKRFDISNVYFKPHYKGVDCLHLVRLITRAGDCGYLSEVFFGNNNILFAIFWTEQRQEFVIDATVEE